MQIPDFSIELNTLSENNTIRVGKHKLVLQKLFTMPQGTAHPSLEHTHLNYFSKHSFCIPHSGPCSLIPHQVRNHNFPSFYETSMPLSYHLLSAIFVKLKMEVGVGHIYSQNEERSCNKLRTGYAPKHPLSSFNNTLSLQVGMAPTSILLKKAI